MVRSSLFSPMTFADLHELLRQELVRRIEAGLLTGTRLAQQTGFRQAHISNFLNARRALSLEGLDRVLDAQKLTIERLIGQAGLPTGRSSQSQSLSQTQLGIPRTLSLAAAAADSLPPEPVHLVPVVSAATAIHQPRVSPSAVIESLSLPLSRLDQGAPRTHAARTSWQRFVAVRIDKEQSAAMAPLLPRGSLAVLDRHYTSLAPFRSAQPNLYAVRSGSQLLLRYVDLDQAQLILRPLSLDVPIQILNPDPALSLADHLVGRVCLQLADL